MKSSDFSVYNGDIFHDIKEPKPLNPNITNIGALRPKEVKCAHLWLCCHKNPGVRTLKLTTHYIPSNALGSAPENISFSEMTNHPDLASKTDTIKIVFKHPFEPIYSIKKSPTISQNFNQGNVEGNLGGRNEILKWFLNLQQRRETVKMIMF